MRKTITAVACACALALLSTGCAADGASSAKGIDAAKPAQQAITVYTALENEQIDRYLPAFQGAHPDIDVNIVRDSTGIITARLLAEGANTPADVVWGTAASSLLVLKNEGMLAPYAPQGLDRVQSQFRDATNPPLWVGIDAWETAIVINTEEAQRLGLPDVTSYEDLLDPAFAGQIVMSNPNSSGTGFLTVSGWIQLMGEEKAYQYMDALHNNIAMYTHSGSAPAKNAAKGEFAVGISYGYACVNQRKAGLPVKVVFPEEGSGWDVEANALIVKDAVKPAAQAFLDWAISDAAMNLLKDDYAITSVPTDVAIPEGYTQDPATQLIANNDLEWAARNRDAILKAWMARYDGKTQAK